MATARRTSMSSNGGTGVHQDVGRDVHRRDLADRRPADLALMSPTSGTVTSNGKIMSNLSDTKDEDRRRAVGDDRVLDAVEVGLARLPVVRDCARA